MKIAKPIVLNKRDLQTLKTWANSTTIEARIKERAKIILLAYEGKTNKEIAQYMHTREATIGKWRSRFIQSGLSGLDDLERTGKPKEYSAAIEKNILQLLDTKPPKGYSSWNGNLIAEHLGNVLKSAEGIGRMQVPVDLQNRLVMLPSPEQWFRTGKGFHHFHGKVIFLPGQPGAELKTAKYEICLNTPRCSPEFLFF